MASRRQQSGYFLIIAVLLIMVMGVIGGLISSLSSNKGISTGNQFNGAKAFYIAESAIEIVAHGLTSSSAVTPLTCATLTGDANVTNASLLGGTFTATAVNDAVYTASSTLASNLNTNTLTISVADAANYASHGIVKIDSEAMSYAAISGNDLIGVQRGVGGTTVASHTSGANVTQNMCLVKVQAGVPSIASPIAKRELEMGVEIVSAGSSTTAWAMGSRVGNAFGLASYNTPTTSVWTDASITDSNRENLMGVSINNNDDSGWAVGLEKSGNFTMLKWDGSAWTVNVVSGACTNQDLYSVSNLSLSEAWSVGATSKPGCSKKGSDPKRYNILKWNGTSWAVLTPSTSPSIPADSTTNQNLNGVSMVDTSANGLANLGFAVGDSGRILYFNGTNWVAYTSPTSSALYGVATISASEAWAVGAGGLILKWNGTSWSSQTSPTGQQLNAIAMLDTNSDGLADFGWAVGAGGTIIYYNGTSWSTQISGTTQNLTDVAISATDEAWAVGAGSTLQQWDGSSWSSTTSPISTDYNGVAFGPTIGSVSSTPVVGSWKEIFG